MEKKPILISVGIATIFLIVSFTSTIAFQLVNSTHQIINSPLFYNRLKNIVIKDKKPLFSPVYIGKNNSIKIPLPTREVITEDLLNQLTTTEIKEQIRLIDNDLVQKWDNILTIAKNNLQKLNRIIRQDYNEFQTYLSQYSMLSKQDAQNQFINMIHRLDLHGLQQNNPVLTNDIFLGNITTGSLCNITSGQFCQITTQPICQITTQPICSITKGFFCWTLYGPICPTTGIKCHPPTSRPILCSIFAVAGKILKTIILVLLLATVIFVPIGILSLVLITMRDPERCEQIHEQITLWFNCTTPK